MNWWKSSRTFPFSIFLIALILRLIPVLATSNMGIGLDDMFQYDMLARSIAAGNGYRWYAQADLPLIEQYIQLDWTSVHYDPRGVLTSFRPPLYPGFLALIYFVTGVGARRFFIARLIQAPLAAALVPLTYALGRKLFPESPKPAVIASWVVAVYPMLVIYPLSLATENLFFVLALASALVLLRAMDPARQPVEIHTQDHAPNESFFRRAWRDLRSARWFILAGILFGLTALTRSVAMGMAGLAFLWIGFILRRWKAAVLFIFSLGLVTVPWMVRNTIVDHRLTGIESALGYDLYVGYHPQGSGTFQYPISVDLLPMLDDGQRDALGREKALAFMQADPGRFPTLMVWRAGYFFGLERRALTYFYSNDFIGPIQAPILILVGVIFCLPFIIVSTSFSLGLALAKWRKETLLMILLILAYIMPHLFIIAEDRFHLAMVPLFSLLAAYSWSGGWAALRERWKTRNGKIAVVLACLAIGLLCTNWTLELWRDSSKVAQLLSVNGNNTYFSY